MEEEIEKDKDLDVILDNDIRRLNFWKYYLKPTSETYSSAKKSAIKAGYSESYASIITSFEWFKKKLRHMNLYRSAEKVLDEALKVPHIDREGKVDAAVLRVKTDTAKHVTKNLGKDDGWTERTETTGKDGTPVIVMPPELIAKFGLTNLEEKKDEENNEE